MCGRFTLATDVEVLQEAFRIDVVEEEPGRRYNIAPTQGAPVVVEREGQRTLALYRWGLIPYWSRDPSGGRNPINARAETVAEKNMFKRPLRQRRCLVAADGFYEWRKEGRLKTPYYIHLSDRRPFAMAGLWDVWSSPQGETIRSCAIITTTPNALMERLHQRMPVILAESALDRWLDPAESDPDVLLPLLQPYPAEEMEAYAVSRFVNSPSNDSPRCIEPA